MSVLDMSLKITNSRLQPHVLEPVSQGVFSAKVETQNIFSFIHSFKNFGFRVVHTARTILRRPAVS